MDNSVPAGQALADDLVIGLARFESAMWYSLIAMALIGVITLIAVQFLKLPLRPIFLRRRLHSWLSKPTNIEGVSRFFVNLPPWLSRVRGIELWYGGTAETAVEYFSRVSNFLPRDLFVKEIQNRVHEALEHPSENVDVFLRLTSGAAAFDQSLTCFADRAMRDDPNWIISLDQPSDPAERKPETPSSGYAAIFASAQDRVAASAERNLDELQISITVRWPFWLLILRMSIGVLIAVVGGLEIAMLPLRLCWLLAVLGAIGGYSASFAYDAITIIGRLRPQ